jgi:SAM-dependent methyltransferase
VSEFWLDIGAGMDAEHWAASPAPSGVRRVALDPLLTSAMVASGRLAPLPPDVLRVGGELRPPHSVEGDKHPSFLPFRNGAFVRVHCGFLLHLYLELLELIAVDAHRVLRPEGTFDVLLPHLGDHHCEENLQRTELTLRRTFGNAEMARFEGPFDTFWSDLYHDRTYRIRSRKVMVAE